MTSLELLNSPYPPAVDHSASICVSRGPCNGAWCLVRRWISDLLVDLRRGSRLCLEAHEARVDELQWLSREIQPAAGRSREPLVVKTCWVGRDQGLVVNAVSDRLQLGSTGAGASRAHRARRRGGVVKVHQHMPHAGLRETMRVPGARLDGWGRGAFSRTRRDHEQGEDECGRLGPWRIVRWGHRWTVVAARPCRAVEVEEKHHGTRHLSARHQGEATSISA